MKRNKQNRGFTLIELLVVIAIIGILSAIVLASLNTARNKAKDAKIQSQLSNMRGAAEIYYGNNENKYNGNDTVDCDASIFLDSTSGMDALYTAVETDSGTGNVACGVDQNSWAVTAKLISTEKYWCVDSSGKSKEVTDPINIDGTETSCPTT